MPSHAEKTARISQLLQQRDATRTAVLDFRQHLAGEKFHADTTIQVADVHRWLDLVVSELAALRGGPEEPHLAR
jgi:hypothetical protein